MIESDIDNDNDIGIDEKTQPVASSSVASRRVSIPNTLNNNSTTLNNNSILNTTTTTTAAATAIKNTAKPKSPGQKHGKKDKDKTTTMPAIEGIEIYLSLCLCHCLCLCLYHNT